ncbi:hypothetical protein OKW76_14725 [Sphingomonas sp. S1-29]|uniref:hypothetical protein n=1 Tax=Sphingomonas sp. S1-29 TaxID=2991074 RepID=UPI00223F6EF2|nr:hypothetical protein [Sphingomonas sp. S1-29]UZK69253.1 hypothetical protein OKW76_14725 [Sphingomonas sp. S1-29]
MSDQDELPSNEIVVAAKDAQARRTAAQAKPPAEDRSRHWPMTAIGVGIGSAALAAALLYANRGNKKP